MNTGAVATPSVPVSAVAVALPAKRPLAPADGAVKVIVVPATGAPPASVARTARSVVKPVPATVDWPSPATTVSAVVGLAGGATSSTNCDGLVPSLLEYCLRLVVVPFIWKL